MPKRRSRRKSKEASISLQQHQQQRQQCDVADEHPSNQLLTSHQSLDQVHQQVPVSSGTNEQTVIQKRQTSSEQTDPTNTNQTSSQMTQDKDNSTGGEKRTGRKRRSRGRNRGRKSRRKPCPTTNQTTENVQSADLTNSNRTESPAYYAIKDGKYGFNGVHTDWHVCERYLKNTCGATFKSFSTLEEAFRYVHGDGACVQPPEPRKAKRDVRSLSENGKTDTFPSPEKGSTSLEVVEPPNDFRSPNHGCCREGVPPNDDRPLEDVRPSRNDVLPTGGGPPPVIETPLDETSIGEIPPPEDFERPEEVRLQKWKIEPVLLPTAFFTSEDNAVKREQTLIPVEPASTAF